MAALSRSGDDIIESREPFTPLGEALLRPAAATSGCRLTTAEKASSNTSDACVDASAIASDSPAPGYHPGSVWWL
jgi:hypothetical protein